MPGRPPGPTVLAILAALSEEGPMTRAAICRHLNMPKKEVSPVISRLNRALLTVPKRIYVVRYTAYDEGSNIHYPRAVYAIGGRRDAPKPPRQSLAETKRRSRARVKVRVTSVFDLGVSPKKRAKVWRHRATEYATNNEGVST